MPRSVRGLTAALAALAAGCASAPRAATTSTTTTTTVSAAPAAGTAGLTRAPFGALPDGRAVEQFTLRNANGVEVRAIPYGAILTAVRVPDRAGRVDDVTFGFDDLQGWATRNTEYFGAVVGRYGNRIARGRFTLDGQTYTLAVNNGPNHLHGGLRGFDKRLWTAEAGAGADPSVTFRYTSPDGERATPARSRRASPTRSRPTTGWWWTTRRRPPRRRPSTSRSTPTGTWAAPPAPATSSATSSSSTRRPSRRSTRR
jgi:hypothetical protein